MHLQHLLLYLLLLLPHIQAIPTRIPNLRRCTNNEIQIYSTQQPFFETLRLRNFKNDYTTPLAIAQPTSEYQVSLLIKCAATYSIRVCARSGGHSFLGTSQCPGLVIDLSSMRRITLDSKTNLATIQAGAILGEVLWALKLRNRWMSAGVCPNVGIAGYLLGGGHGPYEGRLGLGCDSLQSVRMITRFGDRISASKHINQELFWSMCGAGGGQYGVITSFVIRTASTIPFDKSVMFRYVWPKQFAAELLEKWQLYDEAGGDVWTRTEIYLEKDQPGVTLYGTCYNVNNVQQCLNKLSKSAFFHVPGRKQLFLSKAFNVLDLHAFLGPTGDWARMRAPDIRKAFLGQRGTDYGASNNRTTQSSLMKYGTMNKPSRQFWQKHIDFCQNLGKAIGVFSYPWVVCQLALFHNSVSVPRDNAFPYRKSNMLTQSIIGGGTVKDRQKGYLWMRKHFKRFTVGVYVNYPEQWIGNKYPEEYWGGSLARLKSLKKAYDPFGFFMNPQRIPM